MNRSIMMYAGAVAAAMAMPSMLLADIDAKAREVLEKVSDFYASQTSVSGKSETRIDFSMPGMPEQNIEMSSKFAASAPNRIMLDASSDMMGSLNVVSNGEKIWMAIDAPGGMKGYVEDESPEDFKGIMEHEEMKLLAQGAESMFMVMNLMTRENLDKFLTEDVESAEFKGVETVDGVEQNHLTVVVSQDPGMGMEVKVPMEMWFRTGDHPSLTRITPDMSGMLMGQEGSLDVTYTYTDWQFGSGVGDDTFAFTAPEGAKKVKSFMDLFGGGGMDQPEALAEGEVAPAFELETLDGGTFNLASFKGEKVVVLDFW
ncbi:MAG: DUF2092 domain-containing protein, partial [Phycisphaerales bacterium]|nr:DUF2092 domain-containing protein [Phycisphaerales bacterium]